MNISSGQCIQVSWRLSLRGLRGVTDVTDVGGRFWE